MTQNFSHGPFPLLLLLLYCLSWTCRRPAIRYPLVLLINFVTIYTGFGIFLGVITPILLILDYWASVPQIRLPVRYFITCIFVSAASLASFFFDYTFQSGLRCFSLEPHSPVSYLAFVALMFSNFFGVRHITLPTQAIGAVLVAAVLVALLTFIRLLLSRNSSRFEQDHNRATVIVCLTAFSLLFCANVAYGRLCGGLAVALQSRYAIYLEPSVLGFYFFLLSVRRESQKFLVSAFLIVVVAASLYVDRGGMGFSRYVKQHWKGCYLQTEDITGCDKVAGYPIYPASPEQAQRTHLHEKLEFLKKTHQNLYLDQKTP